MHNVLGVQTLNSVGTHGDAKDGVGLFVFVDSERVLTTFACISHCAFMHCEIGNSCNSMLGVI